MPKQAAKSSTESNLRELNTKLLARLRAAEAQVAVETAARQAIQKSLEEEKASRAAVEDALASELEARQMAEKAAQCARQEAQEASTRVEKALAAVRPTAVPELSYSTVDSTQTHSATSAAVQTREEHSPRSEASVSAGGFEGEGKPFWKVVVEFCVGVVRGLVSRLKKMLGLGQGGERQPLIANVV